MFDYLAPLLHDATRALHALFVLFDQVFVFPAFYGPARCFLAQALAADRATVTH